MSEKEKKVSRLVGISIEPTRRVLNFGAGQYPERVSCFPPYENVDNLTIGEIYEYEVEHVPTGKSDGKFYHNLTRKNGTCGKSANGEYNISAADQTAIERHAAIQTKLSDAQASCAGKDDLRKRIITRRYCLDSAVKIVSKIGRGSIDLAKAKVLSVSFAKEFEDYVLSGCLPPDAPEAGVQEKTIGRKKNTTD